MTPGPNDPSPVVPAPLPSPHLTPWAARPPATRLRALPEEQGVPPPAGGVPSAHSPSFPTLFTEGAAEGIRSAVPARGGRPRPLPRPRGAAGTPPSQMREPAPRAPHSPRFRSRLSCSCFFFCFTLKGFFLGMARTAPDRPPPRSPPQPTPLPGRPGRGPGTLEGAGPAVTSAGGPQPGGRERGAKVWGPRTWEAAAPRGRGGGEEAARVGGSLPPARALPPRARKGDRSAAPPSAPGGRGRAGHRGRGRAPRRTPVPGGG